MGVEAKTNYWTHSYDRRRRKDAEPLKSGLLSRNGRAAPEASSLSTATEYHDWLETSNRSSEIHSARQGDISSESPAGESSHSLFSLAASFGKVRNECFSKRLQVLTIRGWKKQLPKRHSFMIENIAPLKLSLWLRYFHESMMILLGITKLRKTNTKTAPMESLSFLMNDSSQSKNANWNEFLLKSAFEIRSGYGVGRTSIFLQ